MLVRVDKTFDLFDKNAEAVIKIEMAESSLRETVENREFKADSNQLRILVLGDSYIHGSMIDPQQKFSKQLKTRLDKNKPIGKEIVVLDVSKPNNNTSDNFDFLKYYSDLFQPDIVFWAYHFNDVEDLRPVQQMINEAEITEKGKSTERKRTGLKSLVKKIYKMSKLTGYMSASLQRELKLKGIVLPLGDFYKLTKQSYHKENKDWQLNEDILEEAIKISIENNSKIIMYKLPVFNLLENNTLFSQVDTTLATFFEQHDGVHYLYGYDDFKDGTSEEYRLSKYDGHPNQKAHEVMATRAEEEILKIQGLSK